MLDINYIPSEKKFTIIYSGEKPNSFHFNVRDLNTNLGVFGWWVDFKGNGGYSEWFAPPYVDASYCSGFEVFGYEGENQVAYNKFQFKKLDTTNYFSTPHREQCFDSWEALFYENEIPITFTSDDVVYDLGANYGVFSMWALYSKVKQIYAFEPTPSSYKYTQKNTKNIPNIEVFPYAISSYNGKTKFYEVYNGNVGASSLFKISAHPRSQQWLQKEIEVECIHLEDWLIKKQISNIDIAWVDVQGAEKIVFESFGKYLNSTKVIATEVGNVPLYQGAIVKPELDSLLPQFECVSSTLVGGNTEIDAIYLNKNL